MPDDIRMRVLQSAVDMMVTCDNNLTQAAANLKVPRATLQGQLRSAELAGVVPSASVLDLQNPAHMKIQIKRLTSELRVAQEERVTHSMIKNKIIGLTQNVHEVEPPKWMRKQDSSHSKPGVPTLFLSDLHHAEVVDGKQINNVNEYSIEIAHERIRRLAERTIRLCEIISPKMDYPGLVLPFGGDMFSGNIHDELTATNALNSMPALLDLYGLLIWLIDFLLQYFPFIFSPDVTGNHGRDTRKIWSKDRHHTSFDWLLYCLLAKHYEKDPRVKFLIPDGTDAYYKVFNHSYLLTHGDQFRGGDGVIGPLGPIIRGDHRKRTRNSQISMPYDTMLIGHWHQYIHLNRLIVNGSLKGYDEYAWTNNFPFETAQQALWMTHEKYGITFRMPVQVQQFEDTKRQPWVSIAA